MQLPANPAQSLTTPLLTKLTRYLSALLIHNSYAQAEPDLEADQATRVVFVTVSDLDGRYLTCIGQGKGVLNAALQAAQQIRAQWQRPIQAVRTDTVMAFYPVEKSRLAKRRQLVNDRTLVGMALGHVKHAWLAEENNRYSLISRKHKLNRKRLLPALGPRMTKASSLSNQGVLFSTHAQVMLAGQSDPVQLLRNHPVATPIQPDHVKHSILAARNYLIRHTGDSPDNGASKPGQVHYHYDAAHNKTLKGYNILRHAGTLWSMIELYRDHPHASARQSIDANVDYLVRQIVVLKNSAANASQPILVVAEDNQAKVGGNGLALVALTQYLNTFRGDLSLPQYQTLLEKLQGLARWLCMNQNAQGEFATHKLQLEPMQAIPFISGYYPGEAILGLMGLYQLDRDQAWLVTARKAAKWLIHTRDGDKPDKKLERDHWLLYALRVLYRYDPDPDYLQHTRRIVHKILTDQQTSPEVPDWHGGWKSPPLSTTTACMCEGLSAAWHLLCDHGHKAENHYPKITPERIQKAIEWGLSNQLQYQFTPYNSLFLANPTRAYGGFHCSFGRWDIRIDYVQHSVMSFLNYQRMLRAR